jgi:hypothetical protein
MSPVGAASSLPPPKPRHGKQTGGAGHPAAQKALKRADSNAPFALQCQWFLSNLVAQYYALRERNAETSVADIGGDTRILRQVWHVPDRIDPA